jgi:hypothetical protein
MSAQSKPVSDDSVKLGQSVSKHRISNGLSQADFHNWGTDRKQKLYGSQVAYFERGTLMPKHQFFVALGKLNNDLANEGANGFKFIQKETTRERLQKGTPFLTHDGRVATATDYFSMFIGEQPINVLYTKAEELTDEFCNHYGHSLQAAFERIGNERLLSPKKAWLELIKVEKFPQDPEYQSICRDVLRGAHELTKDEALSIVEEYAPACGGQCPCFHALEVLATDDKDDPVDISDLKKENEKLLQMVG